MEQTIPFSAMKGNAERAVETKNQHLGTKLTRRALYLLAALLLSLAGVGSAQAQCNYTESDFDVTFEDGNNLEIYEGITINYVGANVEPDSIQLLITTGSEWKDTVTAFRDDDWFIQLGPLDKGQYYVKMLPFSNGQECYWLSSVSWLFNITCSPENASPVFDYINIIPPCDGGDTYSIIVGSSLDCGTGEDIEVYLDDQYISGDPAGYGSEVTLELDVVGEHTISLVYPTNSSQVDTTISVGTACLMTTDYGRNSWSINDYAYDPNDQQFFFDYHAYITGDWDGDLSTSIQIEVQYKRVEDNEWLSITKYYDGYDNIIEVPITAKGTWQARSRVICCDGSGQGPWSDTLTRPVYFYTDGNWTTPIVTGICGNNTGSIRVSPMTLDNAAPFYYLLDSNNDTIAGPVVASNGYVYFDGITAAGTYTIRAFVNIPTYGYFPTPYDTTMVVLDGNACDISITDYSGWNVDPLVNKFMFRDPDNPDTFYFSQQYNCSTPYEQSNSVSSYEIQYKLTTDSEWQTITSTDGQDVYIPITSKGTWMSRSRAICCEGHAGPWSDTTYSPIYFYFGPQAGSTITITPVSCDGAGGFSMPASTAEFIYFADQTNPFYYNLFDENDDLVTNLQANGSDISYNNITTPGTYRLALLFRNDSDPNSAYEAVFDTTFTVPEASSCDITATGTPELTILDYSYEDYENSGNFGEFYYRLEIPSVDGTPESIEVQYGLVGSDSPSSVYYNPSTGAGSIKIPITAKGDWEVKMRARCCGGSFPGNIPGDWFLIDTIHHYPNFAISTEGYCYRIPPAQSENGSVSMTFNPPHNVSSNTSEMRVRIFPVDNSSDIKYDGSGTSGAIELADLSEGDYKVYVYINDGTDENTFNAYLDTTFSIGYRFNVTIQNDSSSICATDSVLYRAIVTGGTEPYDFEWVAYETTFGQFDDSIWVNFDIASSDDPGVTVTDADGCFLETAIHVNLLPAYTQETDYYYDSYTYSRNRYIIASQLPFTLQDFTFDGSETSASHEFTFQTAKGCDSIVHIDFSQKPGIALPSSGNLDTTITTGVDVYDDGGFSSAAALHADRTLTLHAPEGNTLELQLTGRTFDLGEGEALYVYDYNGVNDNALLFEYRQGMNPPNMDFTSNSRSLTFRYVTGNSCAQGFIMTVNTKDISNECLPVYNVTSTLEMTAATWVRCNMQWEYSGVADSFEVKYVGLKWNDAEAKLDTINGPVTEYTTSNSIQIGCYNNLGIENCQIAVRAICGVGDTSEACLHSFIPFSPLIIPHTGDTLVVLDSTIRTVALFDEGGYDGAYNNDADGSLTVKAADGYELVIAQSSTYDLENNYDFLYITDDYAGTATNTYLLDTLNGEGGTLGSEITSRSGGFKFTLSSDESETKGGLSFTIYQVKLTECRQPYNPKAVKHLMDITTYYEITDAGIYGSTAGDRVVVKKTNVTTNAITYDTMTLEMGDNSPVLTIEPQYTMDVQLAPLCGYGNATQWSDPMRLSACQMPYSIMPDTVKETSAYITWEGDAAQFLMFYRKTGLNMWDTVVVSGNSHWLTGLAPMTNYEVALQAICSEGDTSIMSNSYATLTTGCGLRPGLDDDDIYIEPACLNFSLVEAGDGLSNMPECWDRIGYTSGDRTYPYITKYTEDGQDFYAINFHPQAHSQQYAILPKIDTLYGDMKKWALSFTANLRNYEDNGCWRESNAVNIGVMTDPTDINTYQEVDYAEGYSYVNDAQYIIPFTYYHGNGLYPALEAGQAGGGMPNLLISDVMVIPDMHIEAPVNVSVTEHPVQSGKALVTWECEEMNDSFPDDGIENFKVFIFKSDGSTVADTVVYEKNFVFNTTPGESYGIFITHQKVSTRYNTTFGNISREDEVYYVAPLVEQQITDSIGDQMHSYGNGYMPFSYGESYSNEILLTSDEVTGSSIEGFMFRLSGSCPVEGFQNVEIYLKDVDPATEFSEFQVTDNGGSYMITDVSPYLFTAEQRWHSAMLTSVVDGWLTIKFDSAYTHNPDKNLLVGVVSWAGDATSGYEGQMDFQVDSHEVSPTEGKALTFGGVTSLTSLPQTFSESPINARPVMMVISSKNCTNDSLIIDTNLCENASIDWRGQTISFSDDDIELHKVAIDSTYNYGWDYTYAYVFNDKAEGVGTGGCDSIYQLRITKRYNEDNNYALENDGFPHVVNCGPYTWRNGVTYDYSMGTYVIHEEGQCDSYDSYGPRVYDTVPGVTSYGCDSIYGLNLTVEPWYTVVFDTTGVDAGTGMTPVNICEGEDYDLPQCTMTMAYKNFVAWEIDGEWYDEGDAYESDWIEGDTLYVRPVFECDVEEIATEYEEFCPNGGEYEWRGKTITMDYAVQHGRIDSIAGVYYIYVYDSVAGAVAGVCDSIYTLRLNMENRLILDEAVINQCEAQGWTWNTTYGDMNHYGSDMGWRWVDDDDDGHKEFDMSTAAIYIDPFANGECGRLSLLSLEIEDDGEDHDIDTVIFIKYKIEWGDGIDTLHSMTMYVCDGNEYFVPECPDTVTREGYDFVYWSDWPECGWEVEPGSSQYPGSGTIYLYGMWESNCEDKEAADTTVMCPNDTLSWHGFTLNGPELQIGEWDSVMTKYGVIPGECDSIYHMHVTVLSRPTLSVTGQEEPLCYGYQTGWIGVAVNEGNTPFQYAMGDSNYTAALDTTEHKFENLAAGTHTVWVKDACGVTDNVEVTITQPTEIMITNMQAYDSTACYGSSHSVNLAVDGGTSPYTYLWNSDNNHMESYLEINTNVAGTHNDTILVTDANGCTATASYTTKVYDSLSVSVSGNDTTYCYGATATPLVVTVEGGVTDSGYTYQWYNYSPIDTATGPSFTVPTSSGSSVLYDNISVTVTNACGEKTAQGPVITVLDSIRMIAQVDDTRLCFGANTAQMEVDVQGGGAFTGQWYMNGTAVTDHNPGDADNKYTPRTDTSGTFSYSLKLTSNAGCGSDSAEVAIVTVYEPFAVTAHGRDTSYCPYAQADTLSISITGNNEEGNTVISWQAIRDTDTTNVNNNSPVNTTYVPETSTAGTTLYRAIVQDGCGTDTVNVATITVIDNTVTLIAPTADASQEVCLGSDITPIPIEYDNGDTISVDGLPLPNGLTLTHHHDGKDTIMGTINADYSGTYTVRISNSCGGSHMFSFTLTVKDTVKLTAPVTNQTQEICLGTAITEIPIEYSNGTLSISPDLPEGLTITTHGTGHDTIKGTPTAPLSATDYMVTVHGDCGNKAFTFSLTVQEAINLATQFDTTYCFGAQAAPITLSPNGGNGEYTYLWVVANHDDMMPSDTLSVTSNSYTPTTDSAADYYYRVTITSGACRSERDVARIYVMEPVVMQSTADSLAICLGTEGNMYDLTDLTSGGNDYEYTYKWFKNGVEIDGETSGIYTPVGSAAGTFTYRAIAIDDMGCMSDTATIGVLTVYNDMAVTVASQDTTYCYGAQADTLKVTSITSGSGNYSYTWMQNNDIVDEGETYVPSTTEVGETVYSVQVTDEECGTDTTITVAVITVYGNNVTHDTLAACDSLHWVDGNYYAMSVQEMDTVPYYVFAAADQHGCDSTVYLNNLTINHTLVASIEPDTLYNCIGNEGSFTVTVTDGSEPTYKWYRNSELIADEISADINFDADSAGTFIYSVVVTDGAGCGRDSLYAGRSIVYSPMAVTADNHDTAYCYGVPADTLRLNVSGGSGNYNYRWFVHDYYETVLGTTAKYKPSTDESGTTIYDVVVSDTECGTDTTFTVATVTVYENFSATFSATNAGGSVCINSVGDNMVVTTNGGIGTYTYQWYAEYDSVGGRLDTIEGATAASYQPTFDTTATNLRYLVTVTDANGCGDTTLQTGWFTVADSARIQVSNPNSIDSVYCYGDTATRIELIANGGWGNNSTTRYYWYINGELSDYEDPYGSFTPSTETSGVFAISAKYVPAGCGSDSIFVKTITVRDAFEVSPEDQSYIYCLNSDVDTLTLEGQIIGSGSYEYQWYAVTGETVEVIDTLAGATNNWYVPATNLAGEVEYRVKVTDLNCGSDTIVSLGYISVMDSIRILSSVDSLYACLGAEAGTFGVEYEGVGEMDYDWYFNGTEVYRDMVNEFMPSSDSAGVFDYYLVLRSNYGCASDSVLAGVLTVTAPIDLTVDNPVTSYCYGATAEAITITPTGGDGTYHYSWLAANNSDFMMGETLDIDTNSYTPATDTNRSYYFRVTVTSGACSASRDINSIYVMPQVQLHVSVDSSSICYGTEGNTYDLADFTSGGTGQYTYQWYENGEVLTGEEGDTYMPVGTTAGTFVYSAVAIDEASCHSDTATVGVLTVRANMAVTSTLQDTTYCYNSTADTMRVTVTGGNGNYNYRWFVHDYYETVLSTEAGYKPATDEAGTTLYDIEVTDNECGTDTSFTVATVTVYNNFSINPVDPIGIGGHVGYVCVNSDIDPLTVAVSDGSSDFTYQWYMDVINGSGDTISTDTIAGATQSTYLPTTDSAFTRDEFHHYHVIVADRVCPTNPIDVNVGYMSVVDSIKIRPSVFQGTEDSTICYGNSIGIIVNLDSIGGSYGKEYYWYIDGEADTYNTNTEPTTPTYSADNPDNPIPGGTYDLSVRVRDNIGCGSDSAHVVTITVHDQFEVNAEEQSNIYCLNPTPDTISVEGMVSGSGDYEYQWYAVTGETVEVIDTLAGATNNWYVPATNLAGEVEYRVKVTDLNCGSDTIVSLGYITVMDSIRILSGVDSLYACLGAEAGTFGVEYEGVGEMDYDWYLNGAEVYRDMVNEFMPSSDSAGVFDYYLVLRSNYGCASDSVLAGVLTVYSPMAVTVDNQDTDYCYGGQADTLRVNVNGGSGRFAYQWMQNGDIADMGRNFVPSTTEVGTTNYSVRVYDSLCGSDTTVMVAAITVHNGAIVSIDDTTALTACYGAVNWNRSLTVIDTTTDTTLTLTYQWYRNDVAIDAATESTYTITSPLNTTGTLIYTVAVSDNYGCTDTTLHALRLTAYPDVRWSRPSDLDQQQHVCINGTANELSVIPSGGNGNYSIAWCDNINYSTLSTDSLYTPPIDSIGTTIINFSLRSVGIDYCAGSFGAAYYINVHDVSTSIDTVTACDSYTWIDTVTYTETPADAMPTFVLQNQYGCDSTVTLNLTVNYSNHDTVTQTSCDIYTWMMTGQSYTTSGVYYDTVQNLAGCDSIVMLDLTVNPSTASNDTMTACDSYTWNNTDYNTSGTYTANLFTAAGCDSTATLYLTVNYSNSATDTVTTCDSVTWIDGNTYSARVVAESPTYTYSNGNAAGCDSVVTLHLVLADSYTARFLVELADTSFYTDSIDECVLNPALVIPENEYEYDMHEFIGWYNQATGDTVQPGDTVTLTADVTFNTVWRALCSNVDTVSYATICDGDTITWRGYTVTSAQAEYADTVAGVVDVLCDSVYHLLVTVHYPTTSDTTMLACDSVWWNNMFFTETPDTTQSFFMAGGNQYGCDSTAYLNLTVNYSIHDYVVETTCDSYVFDNVTYTESTDLPTIGAISDNGCPFITHISLTVNYSYHGEDSATACDMYVWNDMELEEGGDHDYVGYTSDGCDSVVTLHLTMHYTAYGMDTQTACDSLVWIDGNTYFSDFPGDVAEITYLFPGASMYGCDSVAVLDLTMEDHIYVEFISDFGEGTMNEMSSCIGKPFAIPQCEYVNEGFVFDGWVNQVVHDTVMPGDTVFLEESTSFIAAWTPLCEDVLAFTDTALCEGSSFVWRGHDYTNELYSGDYEDVAYAVIENYCDSIYYLRLTVYPVSYNEFYDSVVGSVIWYDEEYTTTGDYSRFCGYNRYGCDSTEVLHLIVNLSIDDKDGEIEVKVYPNPTQGIVNLDGVEIRRIAVLDQVGRAVATFEDTNRIDISDLPAGIYTLYIETSNGSTTRRVVKR